MINIARDAQPMPEHDRDPRPGVVAGILAQMINRHLDPETVAAELDRMAEDTHDLTPEYRECAYRVRQEARARVALNEELDRLVAERTSETEGAAA